MSSIKLIRTSTVPDSLNTFCRGGALRELQEKDDYEVIGREEGETIVVPIERHISRKTGLLLMFSVRQMPFIETIVAGRLNVRHHKKSIPACE